MGFVSGEVFISQKERPIFLLDCHKQVVVTLTLTIDQWEASPPRSWPMRGCQACAPSFECGECDQCINTMSGIIRGDTNDHHLPGNDTAWSQWAHHVTSRLLTSEIMGMMLPRPHPDAPHCIVSKPQISIKQSLYASLNFLLTISFASISNRD